MRFSVAILSILLSLCIAVPAFGQQMKRYDIKVDEAVASLGLSIEEPAAYELVYRLIKRGYSKSRIQTVIRLAKDSDGDINSGRLRRIVDNMERQDLIRRLRRK
jgi:hypothetical protein